MKKFIKVFAIVLCLAMFTPSVVPNIGTETVNAVSKIKLSKTKAERPQGNKLAINLTRFALYPQAKQLTVPAGTTSSLPLCNLVLSCRRILQLGVFSCPFE